MNAEVLKSYLRIGKNCTDGFDLLVTASTLGSKLVVLDVEDGGIFFVIPRSVVILIVLLEVVSNDTLVREYFKIVYKDTSTHVFSLSLLLLVSTAILSSILNNDVLMLSIMASF